MRLLSLDYRPVYNIEGHETEFARFSGDLSAFDFDIVIWDPSPSFEDYRGIYHSTFQGLPSLSEHSSVAIVRDAARRRAEFTEFINSGRTLVVMMSPPLRCYIDTGQREYSGTGRNRATTNIVKAFDLLSAIPLPASSEVTSAAGKRITIASDHAIASLLRKYKKFLSYQSILKDVPGHAIAHVTGTERVVASVRRVNNGGHLILLPVLDFMSKPAEEPEEVDDEDEPDEPVEWLSEAVEFQEDLIDAVARLGSARSDSRPGWASQYSTKDKRRVSAALTKQEKAIANARARLTMIQQELDSVEASEQLYLGTGRALELEVKAVLELLGGTVTEPEPGRDDWRVSFPEGNAVVEVKGVTKSAAERYAAQLEKWVAGALEDSGEKFKGILIVNTWRDRPLEERLEPDFPAQMLPYCTGREHCLVTGVQLFVIRMEVQADSSRAEFWRNELITTSGQISGCEDWRKFIEKSETAEG